MANKIVLGGGAATIGSQDPDNTAGLTAKLGAHNKVDKLMQRHAANWPEALRVALSLPHDDERTETLDTDEVHDALLAIRGRKAFFQEEDELVGAAVRGSTPGNRIVSVVFTKPSGRVGRGVLPYSGMKKSIKAYEKAEKDFDAQQSGHAPAAAGPEPSEALKAEAAAAAKERDEAVKEAQESAGKLAEFQERLERLENPEPFEGYDTLKAGEIVEKIKEGGVNEFGFSGLDRIEEYELKREPQPYATVLTAIKDAAAEGPKKEES